MIPRYEVKEVSKIWTDHYKFETYLKVELALLQALEGKKIPVGIAKEIEKNAKINTERIDEIELEVKHDIIAFCTSITENLDANIGKYFHFGVTSSDVIDTSLMLQIKESLKLVLMDFKPLLQTLFELAQKHQHLPTMGRSHGMNAEPMSFGGKLLGHYCELSRRYKEFEDFLSYEIKGQFSGAVGNYTILDLETEEKALGYLGLKAETYSTQVIPRDRIAKLINISALFASSVERLCVELRHLHHSDINEVHEGFSKGQKGSSTMPHKKNPIAGENLSGLCRILRSHAGIALENIVLWHERDISHSSTERLYLPDHFGLLCYVLRRLKSTLANLVVHEEIIAEKIFKQHTYLSSYYLHELIVKTDLRREDLYRVCQSAAFNADESAESFYHNLLSELKKIGLEKIELSKPSREKVIDIYLGKIEHVFARALRDYPLPK
jgi:adenylosuccinate lyase